jgi:hypothetical protein
MTTVLRRVIPGVAKALDVDVLPTRIARVQI